MKIYTSSWYKDQPRLTKYGQPRTKDCFGRNNLEHLNFFAHSPRIPYSNMGINDKINAKTWYAITNRVALMLKNYN